MAMVAFILSVYIFMYTHVLSYYLWLPLITQTQEWQTSDTHAENQVTKYNIFLVKFDVNVSHGAKSQLDL